MIEEASQWRLQGEAMRLGLTTCIDTLGALFRGWDTVGGSMWGGCQGTDLNPEVSNTSQQLSTRCDYYYEA